MNNKILFKIGTVLAVVIITYVLFIVLIISPNITTYLTELETKHAVSQLKRVETIIKLEEQYLKELENTSTNNHKQNIRKISLQAYNIMNIYYEMYQKKVLTKEEAISYSFEEISNIKYGHKDDYIFILDRTGKLVFHPDERFHLTNIYNTKDANGKLFVDKIISNSVKNHESYTKYAWVKLDRDKVSEKIVHSFYFMPFDLVISSGVYIDNIKKELEVEKKKIVLELDHLIESIELGEAGYIVVMNGKNRVILHPNKELINADLTKVKEPNSNTTLVENLKKAFKENKTWFYKWNKPNDKENFTYDKIGWIKYNKFFDWYIISTVYKEDLQLKAKEFNSLIINFSLAILFVLIIIAMLFIKKLLSPIKVLSKNANLVKNGQLNIRNNIKTNDELGLLGNHFDSMLVQIEKNTKNLEFEVEKRTAELTYKLYYDELTDIKNRESLLEDLKDDEYYALSLIDIEGFDDINELYGYEVGNEILIKVKEKLLQFTSKNNLNLYRINSDVFAILDSNMASFITYDLLLEKIQSIFREELIIDSLGIELSLYITIGTSISQTDSIKSAKTALKEAKSSGLKYIVYNKDIDTKDNIKKTMYWREKIKDAINNDLVIPFYQPIYNSNEIVKYEALMRIYDEIDNKPFYHSPGAFMDISIKTKQYFKLNQIIIQKTLKNLDKIGKDISLNLSFADILDRDFNIFIEEEIDKLRTSQRKRVVFEILESDNISDYEVLDNFIFKYREKGIRIAIDDFGTGYSNFSHILKIKPDYLKIDGSLIKNINTDIDSYEMVKSIIAFSKAMKIKTIAEFIHSEDIHVILKRLNVDEFQGYYLGEPELLIK